MFFFLFNYESHITPWMGRLCECPFLFVPSLFFFALPSRVLTSTFSSVFPWFRLFASLNYTSPFCARSLLVEMRKKKRERFAAFLEICSCFTNFSVFSVCDPAHPEICVTWPHTAGKAVAYRSTRWEIVALHRRSWGTSRRIPISTGVVRNWLWKGGNRERASGRGRLAIDAVRLS